VYPDARRRVAMRGDSATRCTVVYIPAGRDYFAAEPVTHTTDGFNRAQRGEPDTGTRILAPGESFSCTMQIAVHTLP
jgi:aldose 1-epimerase